MRQVALASFRDTSAEPPPVSLVDYFNDARVTGWLSMNGTGNGDSPIGSAVSRVGGWLNSVRGALKLDSAVAEVVGVKRVVIRQAITDVRSLICSLNFSTSLNFHVQACKGCEI